MPKNLKRERSRFHKTLRNFFGAQNGNIGILFALLVMPVLLLFGIATDFGNASRMHSKLQYALDSAVLAGAQGTHLTSDQRIDLATLSFRTNFPGDGMTAQPTPVFKVEDDGRVVSSATTTVKTVFMKIVRINSSTISARSSARAINPKPICLLALNETMDKAIEIGGTGSLEAINCAVQANSTSPVAIYAGGSSTAKASAFCTPGGFSGNNFSPTPKSCYTVEDPYKDLEFPFVGACDHNNIRVKKQHGPVVLNPGTYCEGLDIGVHSQVFFTPGVYKIKGGEFHVHSHAEVTGSDVTIYLTGDDTLIDIRGGASVDLKAPTSGDYEGFLFMQDPETGFDNVNSINGNGSVVLVGTLYFPNQGVVINGSGRLGINSPMMPIIADHFIVNGNGIFQVDLDEARMTLPLPMTNDGSVMMY